MHFVVRIGIAGCAAILALCMSGCGESPGGEAKRAIRAMMSGSVSSVVSLMPPDDRKAYRDSSADQKDRFAEQVITRASEEFRNDEKLGMKRVKILEQSIEGDSARIKVEITYGNGDVNPITVRMKKYGSDWCVQSIGHYKPSVPAPLTPP